MGQRPDSEVIITQEPVRSEEITLQVSQSCFLLVLSMLNTFQADLIATNELITSSGLPCYVWLHDSGNRIKNAVESGIFGPQVVLLEKVVTRGNKKIVLQVSAFDFKLEIEKRKVKTKLIAHTPISQGGVQFIFF